MCTIFLKNVQAQKIKINYSNGRFIYTDSLNRMEIRGIDSTKLVLLIDKRRLTYNDGFYLSSFRKKVGDSVLVKVCYLKKRREKVLLEQKFYIRRTIPYVACIGTFESEDTISVKKLLQMDNISIINFSASGIDKGKEIRVIGYSFFYAPKRGNCSDIMEIEGSILPDRVKGLIEHAKKGDTIIFTNILISPNPLKIKEIRPLALYIIND